MTVWDVKNYIESDRNEPEKLRVFNQVTSFEIKTRNGKSTLYYCKDSSIYETSLQYGHPLTEGVISTRELVRLDHAICTHHADDGKILFADRSENIYLLTNNGEAEEETKLILERQPDVRVKSLSYKDDIVTIVQSDSENK